MQKIAFILLIVFIIISCNNKLSTESFVSDFLNENNLEQQNFAINPSIENKIKTKQGIEFTIPANTFNTNEKSIEIVIKEALSIQDIVKAKLTTQTKDELLSSDGMFYIGTKQNLSVNKSIDVKVPTINYNENMQLFKGNKQGDAIIWENPKPIFKNPQLPNGEALYTKNCAACHAIDKKLTGPALAYVEERFNNRKNLIEYIKNNQTFMQWHYYKFDSTTSLLSNDEIKQKEEDVAYARYQYCVYGKAAMNVFEGVLNDQEINAILDYIKAESKKYPNSDNENIDYKKCFTLYEDLKVLETQLSELINENPPKQMVEVKGRKPTADTAGTIPKVEAEKFEANQSTNNNPSYVFSIEATGWYNIDEFLRKENTVMSNLIVEPNLDTIKRKEIFLLVPSYKIFAQGGLINKTQYSFLEANSGNLPLPQGVKAYAIAFGESNGNLYFGIQEFITTTNQNIPLDIKITTKEAIEKTINSQNFNQFNLKIESYKQPKQIDSLTTIYKTKIKDLENLNCNCLIHLLK